jgi:pimeloyl-ACP methyl ester carboxylesterase
MKPMRMVVLLLVVGLVMGLTTPASAGGRMRVKNVETLVPTSVEPLEQFFAHCEWVKRVVKPDGSAVERQQCELTHTDPDYPGEVPDERFIFDGDECLWESDYFRATDGSVVIADSLRVDVKPSGKVKVVSTYPADPIDPVEGCGYEPRIDATDCWFTVPSGQVADCGRLVVPEDRSTPFSPEIQIGFARFHHPDGNPEPDPIVYLAGGPGESIISVFSFPGAFEAIVPPLFPANRDVIFFDQRGVGVSEPALSCALGDSYFELLDYELGGETLTSREVGEQLAADMLECGEQLGETTDLSAYTTVASAADVNDLRIALGYDQFNLWGVSYGTRLAQVVMRDQADGVRSVAIDAIMSQDLELIEFVAAADRALNVLFEGCAADVTCNGAFPSLGEVFAETVVSLNENPPTLELNHPATGEAFTARLTGDLFTFLLYESLYDTDTLPFLPLVIYATSQGDYSMAAGGIPALVGVDRLLDLGMLMSVRCNRDKVNLPSLHEYDAAVAAFPGLSGFAEVHFGFRPLTQICQEWDSGTADASAWEPVTSSIPTLAMTGEYDPNLAPAFGERVASHLDNVFYFEYPGIGHGSVGSHPCPTAMFVEFIIDPNTVPDASCMAEMGVQFFTP